MEITRRHCLGLIGTGLAAATRGLEQEWRRTASGIDGTVGAAALHLGSAEHTSLNGTDRFPLASVCKLPIAMHFLALVDEGKLALKDDIEILERDIRPWVSKVAENWPQRRKFPLNQLLEWMVAQSDNTAVDALLRVGGGPAAMMRRFAQWRIDGIRIDRSEGQCVFDGAGIEKLPPAEQWTGKLFDQLLPKATPAMRERGLRRLLADPRDTGTPDGTARLLARAFRGELLGKTSTARLVEILEATTTGPARLKGMLPAGTVVAHKTGTGGTAGKLNGTTNDAGVITLPKGAGQLAVAVYVKGSTADLATRERTIARIARAAFDAWSGN